MSMIYNIGYHHEIPCIYSDIIKSHIITILVSWHFFPHQIEVYLINKDMKYNSKTSLA